MIIDIESKIQFRYKYKHRWHPSLSPIEGRIWRILWLADGDIVHPEEIHRRIYGTELNYILSPNIINMHVSNIRKKGFTIMNVDRCGFRLVDQ